MLLCLVALYIQKLTIFHGSSWSGAGVQVNQGCGMPGKKEGKIPIQKRVQREGKIYTRTQWVNPSDVKNVDDRKQKQAAEAYANMARQITAVSKPMFVDGVMRLHENLKRAPISDQAKVKLYTELEKRMPENVIERPPVGAEKLEITSKDIQGIKQGLMTGRSQEIPLDLITEESQIRKAYDPEVVQNIADSIVEQGQLQNVTVRPDPNNPGKYQLVDGHTRYRAIQKAVADGRLDSATIIATVEDMDDRTKAIRQLVANVARKDNTALEISDHYALLVNKHGMTVDDLAKKAGTTKQTVQNYLQIQNLDPSLRRLFEKGEMNKTTAMLLGSIESPALQTRTFALAMQKNWKTQQLRQHISDLKNQGDFFSEQDVETPKQRKARQQLEQQKKDPSKLQQQFQQTLDREMKFLNKFFDEDGTQLSTLAAAATGNLDSSLRQLELVQNELERVARMMKEYKAKQEAEAGLGLFKAEDLAAKIGLIARWQRTIARRIEQVNYNAR